MKASDSSAERTEELQIASVSYREEGIPFHVCDDALEAAHVLFDAGLVDDLTLEEVETELGAVF